MKYKYKEIKSIPFVKSYGPKSTSSPLRDTAPVLKDSFPLKILKGQPQKVYHFKILKLP